MMRAFPFLLALLLGLGFCPAALAHQSSLVFSEVAVRGRAVEYTFQVASTDLYEALKLPQDRPVTREQATASKDVLSAYLAQRVTVSNNGLPCPAEPTSMELADRAEGFFVVQHVAYRCPRSIEDASITYNLFFDIDPRHQGLAHIEAFGAASEHVFRERDRTLHLTHALTSLDNARDYLELGVEHIFTGYDHLAFLFCLLIIAGRFSLPRAQRPGLGPKDDDGAPRRRMAAGAGYVVRVVTAFTLAHSVTLILSALNFVSLPGRLVEPAIAASIAYVAAENIAIPLPRHRFLLTFCFGLVHGFGFSSVLREIGLPKQGLLLSLLSFNLGVEIGQLLVVAMVFPVLHLLASRSRAALSAAKEGLFGSFKPVEIGVVAGLSALSLGVFSRFGLPWVQLCAVVLVVPALLVGVVPRFGYDRCVRVVGSGVVLALALLWLAERVFGHTVLSGALG